MDAAVFAGKSFKFSKGLVTMDPYEGSKTVELLGGIVAESSPGYLVVSDQAADAETPPKYVENARQKGIVVLSESSFRSMAGMAEQKIGIADRWVVVDDYLEEGKIDVSNSPGWDGTVPKYKLFIQCGTAKTTSAGGWRVVDCGELSLTGYTSGNFSGANNPVPWGRWRNDIGAVVVRDKYAPTSCEWLFDGLVYCTKFDLSGLDTSRATSMRGMFRGCSSIDYFMATDRFDTSNVTSMSEMFFGCINAQVINCIGWDLSSVNSMYMMFENSPAAVLFDDANIPIPERIDSRRMFDSGPREGRWLKRI